MTRGVDRSRGLTVRPRPKRGRKASSQRWIERQLNDPYVRRAQAEGYRARSAYKLLEIDDRYHILKTGSRVVDLGAAPGGWSQVAVQRTGSLPDAVGVVGIDYLDVEPVAGTSILQMDFLDDAAPQALLDALGGAPDIVLSDMAAPTTGHKKTDHLRTMHLVEVAADFAVSTLRQGGHFLAKTFQGGTEAELLARLKRDFASVHHVKPPASRDGSVELYMLAKGFRGASARQAAAEEMNDPEAGPLG